MACLTSEQLAQLALGLADDESLLAHVDQCETCRAALAKLRQLNEQLAAAHADLDRHHAASRAELLARLPHVDRPRLPLPPGEGRGEGLQSATWRRIAYGGIGLSSAAALLLIAFFATSAKQLSAMERMVKAVREVTSYSFKNFGTDTYLDPDGKPKAIRRDISYICWRAPDQANRQWYGDLYGENKAWKRTISEDDNFAADDSATPTGKPTFHIAETHATRKPGIIIFYTGGYYFWVPPLRAGAGLVDNHMAKLRAVQQGQGKVVRELGSRMIDGREARGYVVDFEDAFPFKGYSPVEVWVDPQTDLPMELSFKWNEDTDKIIDESRITDIRWNIDFPPNQFATVAPADLIDSTPPTDEHDISQIVSALKLYAELSGGHYPRVHSTDRDKKYDPAIKTDPPNRFEGELVRGEMLRLAGFTGPTQPEWQSDPKFQQIQSATTGLDWLTRVLIDSYRSGFFGAEVGSQDKDKVLLWWMAGTEDDKGVYSADGFYRVFYGDLRTEIIPDAEFAKLVPTAASRQN